MAGEGHERSETEKGHYGRRPPSFGSGCGRSGEGSPCALSGPRSLDVTTRFTRPMGRKELGEPSFRPIRKGRATVVEPANGRPEGGAPVGPAAGTVANAEEGYALDPWSRLRGRGERCLQSPRAVALSKAPGVPELCKGGDIGHGT